MNIEALLQERSAKDSFIQSEQSPFPKHIKEQFNGLSYFDPDPDLYFEVTPTVFPEQELTELPRTDGGTDKLYRYAQVQLSIADETVTLIIYQNEQGLLSIPFRDKTNGMETYGGGRYIKVHQLDDGRVRVDFNRAENFICAYLTMYHCTLPPRDNDLSIAIRAGEKLPQGEWVMA